MSISSLLVSLLLFFTFLNSDVLAQRRRAPTGGRVAIVVDERLAAVRATPSLTGVLVRRLGRGRLVAVRGERHGKDGLTFARVNVTSRTGGWIQRDALVIPNFKPDEERLLRLIRASEDFDRIERARIFLDEFPRSAMRPEVLLIFGDAAESAAARLSRDAGRRLKLDERGSAETGSITTGNETIAPEKRWAKAPEFSYFLNYVGLDRYNRQGIRFLFDRERKKFYYDGAVWKELLKRYPRTPEAAEARKLLSRE